ncbi:MAG: hypothetical protein ACPGVP_16720 [Thiolinea sp.]
MYIRQAPKLLLSFLLIVPAISLAAESSRATLTQPSKATAKSVVTQKQQAAYPKRGMSMKQVRKLYGQPDSTRQSKGKVKKQWPRITVWNYGAYSVYFERSTVLHTVVH